MEITLIGALDYKKIDKLLEARIPNSQERARLIEEIKMLETGRRAEIVSTAGRLSRAKGTIFDILGLSENKTMEQNISFINRVTSMGHDSINDHDYCVFGLKDVSPIVEQTIIAERFASFTIKSRREVDFSKVGFYVPDFRGNDLQILPNNSQIQEEYIKHMQMLFDSYATLTNKGINIEDARFLLPYCYHSNIIMGMDAHSIKDLIIKLTKTKYSNISELKEVGEKLYKIAEKQIPYIISEIDKVPIDAENKVQKYLNKVIPEEKYEVLKSAKLLNYTSNVDDTILLSAIMREYKYSSEYATKVYKMVCSENPSFKQELMKKIAFEGDGLELTQVNFKFEFPTSLAVLTHFTRHRTHDIIVPDFVPNIDLEQYKTPPSIEKTRGTTDDCAQIYDKMYTLNKEMYEYFQNKYNICEEDLIYFSLSGNTMNVQTSMDGKTLHHILSLRECTKSQWETREIAGQLHSEVKKLPDATVFETILGPSCETQTICKEGKESCGKVLVYQKQKNNIK